MSAFRYQAVRGDGGPAQGIVEAEDRRDALRRLGQQGLFPSALEACADDRPAAVATEAPAAVALAGPSGWRIGRGVRRKDVTAFTREIAALVEAGIPIPQALDSLGQEETNPVLRRTVLGLAESVRKGAAFSAALEEHPRLFNPLYVSMVRVGEEAGALPRVLADLTALLEHEDEVRGEVGSAVAYPVFVLGFGVLAVVTLLTFVLPRLFEMLQGMMQTLPLPTRILLAISRTCHDYWWLIGLALIGAGGGVRAVLRSPGGRRGWDAWKLRLPYLGGVFRSAALARFSRTLGTLARSGVSLLPALRIVEHTIGNVVLAQMIARVAEDTRGGDSFADPLRKLGVFPNTLIQMISVGENTGKLDEMLLKVAAIEERQMRHRTRTLISLLAPAMILVVGALVGFVVIALLLPIFKMSRALR
ncbi:MAG: type II secretion system F family protein [Verrucomicrobiales bacterium]|nr:type II secretion system F family protein [Verrucomicrobiales bacterium]